VGRAQEGKVGYKGWKGRAFKKQKLGEEEAVAGDDDDDEIDFEAL
jgi:hypothetical protein